MPVVKANISISAEVRRRWQEFAARESLSSPIIENAEPLQSLWQQSFFSERMCESYPRCIGELLLSSATEDSFESNYEQQLRTQVLALEDEAQFKVHIRNFRNQHLLRLCWRDLILQVEPFVLLRELSALADACIRVTVDWLLPNMIKQFGDPQTDKNELARFLVIALGKLGGRELNFSSDIDVMFCYSDSGNTNGLRSISNQEFFIRIAQKLIHLLSDVSANGFVYRVDCRLRPFGEAGPLAVNFNHLEDYYQTHGREWERYAFIKARVVYGTDHDQELFKQIVSSFVYRKYIDFGVINTLREMKYMIAEQVNKKQNKNNIKLGAGGIREIEFIVQFFQLANGGRNTRLQTNHIDNALTEIERSGYLSKQAVQGLTQAYLFLRRVENRLQMRNDEQTHVLPEDPVIFQTLAESMLCQDGAAFTKELRLHIEHVSEVFAQISGDEPAPDTEQDQYVQFWELFTESSEVDSPNYLDKSDFKDSQHICEKLVDLKKSSEFRNQDHVGRDRLHTFMPIFLRHLQHAKEPGLVMDRLYMLIVKILRRSAYLILLSENKNALDQLISVASASPWIASHLTTYPLLLDEIALSLRIDSEFTKQDIENQFRDEVLHQAHTDYEQMLENVRAFKHARELRVACADVQGKLPIMRVSDQLSWTAEAIVNGCLQYLDNSFDSSVAGDMAVIAFGKLGGIELSYGSDLDLVYIAKNEHESDYSSDAKVPYFVKLSKHAQRLTQMLTLQTISGKLYEVDTRLRPDGESGPIVAQLDYVRQYYQSRAWMWEIQALVRARCIAGPAELCQQFETLRCEIICAKRDPSELAQQVMEMRSKMLLTKRSKSAEVFDLKNDEGGITDIEFMVQYAVLAHAYKDASLCGYSDNVRLLERLASRGFLSNSIANELTDIYCQYRNRTHRLALQAESTKVSHTEYLTERELVRTHWKQILEKNIN